MEERAGDRFNGLRMEGSGWIAHFLRGDRASFAQPSQSRRSGEMPFDSNSVRNSTASLKVFASGSISSIQSRWAAPAICPGLGGGFPCPSPAASEHLLRWRSARFHRDPSIDIAGLREREEGFSLVATTGHTGGKLTLGAMPFVPF
jgi:hypothetical protein